MSAQAAKPSAREAFDGLYYVTSPASGDPYGYRVVLSHDGKKIAPKENDPDEPTEPGLYRKDVRYPFEQVAISGKRIAFRTAAMNGASYTFEGALGTKREPDFDDPIPFFRGTLSELRHGKLHSKRPVTLGTRSSIEASREGKRRIALS